MIDLTMLFQEVSGNIWNIGARKAVECLELNGLFCRSLEEEC